MLMLNLLVQFLFIDLKIKDEIVEYTNYIGEIVKEKIRIFPTCFCFLSITELIPVEHSPSLIYLSQIHDPIMRILLTFAFCLLFGVGLQAQKTHTVNTVDDVDDGVCDNEHCSLREAITAANTDGFNSFITFEINGPGTKVITLDTELPIISGRLEIDGNSLADNAPTKGLLVIDGNEKIKNGLHFETPDVKIYGVQFQGFLENAILLESESVDIPTTATIGRRERGNIFIKNGTAVKAENIEDLFFQANYVGTNIDFEEGLGNRNGVIVDNNWASFENSLLFIGGEKDRLEHNYFANSSEVALSLSYQGVGIIEGNIFGTGLKGNENLGNNIAVQTTNGRGRVDIGGDTDTKNVFAYNGTAVIIEDNSFVNISENSFYCNALGLTITRNTYPIPTITSGVETMLTGIAQPFDVIEVYISDEGTCQSEDCQGMVYVGNAGASNTGTWQFPGFFDFGQQVVALSRNSGRQSMFSQCFKVCPGAIQSIAKNTGPYCENDTIQLFSDMDIFGFQWVTQFSEKDIVYDWKGPNGFSSNEKNPKRIAESGDYTLQTYLLGCPSRADTTEVEVTALKVEIEEIPENCRAENIELKSSITSNIGRVAYHWSGPDNYTASIQNPTDAKTSGVYNLFISGDGCQSEIASVVIENHFPEPFSLGDVAAVCAGETVSLAVPNYDFYQWGGTYELTCDTCSSIQVLPNESGAINLIAGPTATCTVEAAVTIEVIQSINIIEERILCPGSSINVFTKTIDQPGTYQATFTAQSGCDSNHTFLVIEPEVNRVIEAKTICTGEVVNQFGQTYTTSGIYEGAFTAANGCDSTHVLELKVLEQMFVAEAYTICAGESMNIFGTDVSESTTVSKVFTAANGCDSTHQISLAVEETYHESTKVILCAGETVAIDGLEVAQNGFFQRDYTAINGCDSVIMIEVQVVEPIKTFQHITLCEQEALDLFGEESAFPSDYTETFTAQSGCDSMNYVSYDIRMGQEVEEYFTICGTDRLIVEGNEITESGRYSQIYSAANGCDSTHITYVTVLDIPYSEVNYELCAGESIDVFGTMINSAGIYSAVLADVNGCDSFHTVTVFVKELQTTNEIKTICEGESVTVFDKLVTSNDIISKTFSGTNGCDSVHSIQVTVLEEVQTSGIIAICEAECIELYGATVCADKVYEQTFTAFMGCDSTHTLLLELLTPQEIVQEYSLCVGDSLPVFDSFIKEAGTFSQAFTGSNGCDSMHTFIVTQPSINEVVESKIICEGESHSQFGENYATTGRYEASFTAMNGCDSTHVLELTVLTQTFAAETYSLCAGESLLIFGDSISKPGIISQVFTAANGCDSTHTVTVFVKEAEATNEVMTICAGETVTLFGQLVTADDIVSKTFSATNGCDSVHTIAVNVLEKVATSATTAICEVECIDLYGAKVCLDKVYEQTFTAFSGCDSTHTLLLEVLTPQEIVQEYSLCVGDSLAGFDSFIKEAGTFSQVFTGANGCDSMHTFVVTQTSVKRIIESKTICAGETHIQFGESYAATGTYEASFTAMSGCDSIHILELIVLEQTFAEETYELCAGETLLVFGEEVSEAGILSKTFTSDSGCDSTHIVTIFVKETQTTNELITICEGETVTLFDELITSDAIVSKTFSGASGCDSTHTIEVRISTKMTTEATTSICATTCIDLYGATACANKVYQQTFTASSGCDSVHTLFLITTNQQETRASYTLCLGDSLAAFGNFIKEAGEFSESFTSSTGCDSMHTILIDFTEEIMPNITTSPSCLENNGGQVELSIAGGLAPYIVHWEGNNIGNSLAIENLESGNYDLMISDASGCQWAQKIDIASIPVPEVEKEILAISCFGANDGAVDLFSNQANLTYSLDGINYTAAASFINLPPATYQVFIKDEIGCNHTEQFTLYEPAPLTVSLPAEKTIKLGASVQLVPVVSSEGINYDWTAVSSLSCLDCKNPIARPLEDTKYTLTIYDENNCEGQAEMWLRVDDNKNIYIPNVFSPDDDGMNDVFTILTGESPIQEIEMLKVYDRWGNLMYEANHFDPLDERFGWNGRYKGKPMDNGVYIYFVSIKYIDGTEEELSGDITLAK